MDRLPSDVNPVQHSLAGLHSPDASREGATTAPKNRVKPRQKRVGRACESCRKKRLKCTAGADRCLNCLLYNAECVYPTAARGTAAARQRKSNGVSGGQPRSPPSVASMPSDTQPAGPTQEPPLHASQTLYSPRGAYPAPDLDGVNVDPNLSMSFQMPPQVMAGHLDFSHFNEGMSDLLRQSDGVDARSDDEIAEWTFQLAGFAPSLSTHCNPSPTPTPSRGRVSGGAELDDDSCMLDPFGLSIFKDNENGKFIGSMSTGAIVSSSLASSIRSQAGVIKKSDSLDYLIGAVEHVDETNISPASVDSQCGLLPERALAESFLDAYRRTIHKLYPIVDAEELEAHLARLYEDEVSTRRDPTVLSRLYLVLAIGALNQDPIVDCLEDSEKWAKNLHQRAWDMFHNVVARPYLESIQVILLHVIYMFHFSKSGFAWVLSGLAIRISQSLGLYRADLGDPCASPGNRLLRSRIWWTGYSLDAFLSANQGRLPATPDDLCNAPVLRPAEEGPAAADTPSSQHHPPAEIFAWLVALSRIKNQICFLFGCPNANTVADRASSLDALLSAWRDQIPLEYRPDQEILASAADYPFVAMLHLQYFNMSCTLHWTLIQTAKRHRLSLREHSNPRIRASEAICVAAARSFVKILNDISSELGDKKIPPICIHTDHYMAAISILFANIFKDPSKVSARTDFEFLRAGHYHFERHVNPLRFNGRLQSLFQKIQAAAEELLQNSSVQHRSPGSSDACR